ncbi:LysR family transcriptional regulator [Allokutzneria albata]|uniref:DNA-binding transcriptional regulator, LysR family n=1 Tax=Allokutzneria albata TaxID=211114 RepID=A0A1G9SB28_ALLAB|nr:LysR family transcriptional regulator [Allokutzneria albata]SDM32550.1 DNA-binding transcriptional regulator, LysR family [Allokutzneria albata]
MTGLASLRAFVAVVDAGGFAAAAERLSISQSGVSHSIAALERACGRPVLARGSCPRPTQFGEQVLVHARVAVAAVDAVKALACGRDGQPSGVARLAAPPSVAGGLVPGLLARWRVETPAVSVEIFEGDDDEVRHWLDGGTVDLAVLTDPTPVPEGAVVVGVDRFAALLRTDHPLAAEPAVTLADLEDDPFLLSAGGCEPRLRLLHQRAGMAFTPTHRIRQFTTLAGMVAAGVGVSVVPDLSATMLPAGVALVPITPTAERTLVLTGPTSRPWHPLAAALIDVVSREDDEARAATSSSSQPSHGLN